MQKLLIVGISSAIIRVFYHKPPLLSTKVFALTTRSVADGDLRLPFPDPTGVFPDGVQDKPVRSHAARPFMDVDRVFNVRSDVNRAAVILRRDRAEIPTAS